MAEDDEPVPISALQHVVFCLRQAALIHVERLWAENRFTAEGQVLHMSIDEPGARRRRDLRRVTALPVACRRLGLAGVADVVEFHREADGGETPFPVEFKRGRPKAHRADDVQLCAQALCLEEMTGRAVPEGALFYGETRRRLVVPFDADLRRLTEDAAAAMRRLIADRHTPPAVYQAGKCRVCSLIELCRPKVSGRSAAAWRDRMVAEMLDADGLP